MISSGNGLERDFIIEVKNKCVQLNNMADWHLYQNKFPHRMKSTPFTVIKHLVM